MRVNRSTRSRSIVGLSEADIMSGDSSPGSWSPSPLSPMVEDEVEEASVGISEEEASDGPVEEDNSLSMYQFFFLSEVIGRSYRRWGSFVLL